MSLTIKVKKKITVILNAVLNSHKNYSRTYFEEMQKACSKNIKFIGCTESI